MIYRKNYFLLGPGFFLQALFPDLVLRVLFIPRLQLLLTDFLATFFFPLGKEP